MLPYLEYVEKSEEDDESLAGDPGLLQGCVVLEEVARGQQAIVLVLVLVLFVYLERLSGSGIEPH